MQTIINNIKYIKYLLQGVAILIPIYVYFDIRQARDFGGIALNLLLLSLIIGPLGKIFTKNILGNFIKFLMLIRGEIGMLMASAAIAHGVGILSNSEMQDYLLSSTFTDMYNQNLPLTLGMLALLLTIPLLITSNIYLKEKMGAWWYKMHKLAYAIFIFGALHAAFIKDGISLDNLYGVAPYFVIYIIVIISAKIWGKKKEV